jgi:hypothetical protein
MAVVVMPNKQAGSLSFTAIPSTAHATNGSCAW